MDFFNIARLQDAHPHRPELIVLCDSETGQMLVEYARRYFRPYIRLNEFGNYSVVESPRGSHTSFATYEKAAAYLNGLNLCQLT